jgi:PadR family transcriptional regulator PadR
MKKGKNDILQGTLTLLVLKTLAAQGACHGYRLCSHIQSASADLLRVEEGSLYPALHRMEEAGLIRASWIVKDKEKGRRSRVYELTADGRKQLAADEERWTAIAGAVMHVLKHA